MAALRTTWNNQQITELAARVSDYRSQLTLRLIVVLNHHVAQQHHTLGTIRDEIVEVISLGHQDARRGQEETIADLIPSMLTAFLDSDRAFAKARSGGR